MSAVPKKILFAMSDTGGGHRSAAMAINAAISTASDASCTTVDFLRATRFPGLHKAPEIYDYCSKKHLWLNNLFFKKTDSVRRINTLTKMVYLQAGQHIERELAEIEPDIIVAVHPLVIGLMRLARERLQASWPIITVVTDLVTFHASWATPGADWYLTPTGEATNLLAKNGVSLQRIVHTGFPIHPKFAQARLTQTQARNELGIDSGKFTVLLTGGGVGAGGLGEWVSMLEKQCADKQILVITGNNKGLYNELKSKKMPSHINIYGFVGNMEVMMAASDIVITKAGPGTIMESAAMKRPLIITEAVGIQEIGNISYVEQNQLGYYCPSPELACKTINGIASQLCGENNPFDRREVITDGSSRIATFILQHMVGAGTQIGDGGNTLGSVS
ncbi:MAG: Monogalactosyldiacylglycerol synthase [Firmicutes bacterium]|nr:Monogalactosyldiacylglycerol synthase [Bacillota bacterium]